MITAQLATIPGREESRSHTLKSLVNQVDKINMFLNDFTYYDYMGQLADSADFAGWNHNTGHKVKLIFNKTNNGDAEKFNGVDKLEGYIFTCDDDLIYPPDYVETMIKKIEQYGRKALITCHGRTFPKRKIKSYYKDKLEGFRCLGTVEKDTQVHSGGTGVMAWHSDLWRPEMSWFKAANMADVFIAGEAKKRNIPIICIAHREGWIKYIEQEPGTTIWERHIDNDSLQTKYFNEFWP